MWEEWLNALFLAFTLVWVIVSLAFITVAFRWLIIGL